MRHDGNPGPIEAQIINSNTLKGSSSVLEHGNFLAAEGSILRTNNVTKIETSRKLYRATLANNPLDPELFQKWAIASQSLKGENPKMDLIMNEIQRRIDQQFEGPEN